MTKPLLLSTLFLWCCTFPAFQQTSWTLEQCISYAMQNNLQVKMQEINVQYYKNNYNQSLIGVLPSVNANANFSASSGRALDQTTYQYTENKTVNSLNSSVNSSVTLFNGFQNLNKIRQNHFNVLASMQEVEKLKNDIALNLALAYLQLLLNYELRDAASNQLGITKLQLTHTQQLYDAGSVPQSKLLEVQAQVANEELSLVNSENQVDISLLTLKQMLDLDTMKTFKVVVPDFSNIPIADITTTVDDIYQQAVVNLPQIKQSEYQLKSSEKGLDLARSARSFRLTLSYSYGSAYSDSRQKIVGLDPVTQTPIYANYPFEQQFKDNVSSTVSLGLTVPLFNGWMVNSNISNSKLNVQTSRYQLDLAQKQLYKEIQQAQADAVAAYKKFTASDNAVKSTEESFRSIQQKYDLGLVNFVDYSSSKNQLAVAQSQLLQAKYNYIFKSKVLEFYKIGTVKL